MKASASPADNWYYLSNRILQIYIIYKYKVNVMTHVRLCRLLIVTGQNK